LVTSSNMAKLMSFPTSDSTLLGMNNVIEWELPSPLDNSRFLHSLFRACFITGHVI
jgi:hypothetical protein